MEQPRKYGRIGNDLLADAHERRQRHAKFIDAFEEFERTVGDILQSNPAALTWDGAARQVVSGCYAKALKTTDLIRIACEAGYGEDAMVLLRTLVNVTISMAYIVRDEEPEEHAQD